MLLSTLQASALSVLMLAVVYWPLERLWPARQQPWLRRALGTDFLFLFGQHLVWSVLALAFLAAVDARVHGALPAPVRDGFLALPRAAQLLAIVLLGDLGVYWFHRACHRFDFLWRFHAVHHSSETLDWVAAHREHPVDGLLTQLTLNLPAMLLGFPVEGLAALAVFRGLWAIFIHSNVRLPLGPLRYVLGAPELHHWHHAKAPGVVANYGNLSPWTDLVFGTFHLPPAGEETWELGVPEQLPRTWPGLLVSPFTRAWTKTSGLLRAPGLGPASLVVLVVATFTALSANAEARDAGAPATPDAGANGVTAVFGDSAVYLPATKSFGGTLAPATGLGVLGPSSSAAIRVDEAKEADVRGDIDRNVLRRVMLAHTGEWRRCAEQALLGDAGVRGISGRVVVAFTIGGAGSVTSASVAERTVAGDELGECLVPRVKRLTFPRPPPGAGPVGVRWPFRFEYVAP